MAVTCSEGLEGRGARDCPVCRWPQLARLAKPLLHAVCTHAHLQALAQARTHTRMNIQASRSAGAAPDCGTHTGCSASAPGPTSPAAPPRSARAQRWTDLCWEGPGMGTLGRWGGLLGRRENTSARVGGRMGSGARGAEPGPPLTP